MNWMVFYVVFSFISSGPSLMLVESNSGPEGKLLQHLQFHANGEFRCVSDSVRLCGQWAFHESRTAKDSSEQQQPTGRQSTPKVRRFCTHNLEIMEGLCYLEIA